MDSLSEDLQVMGLLCLLPFPDDQPYTVHFYKRRECIGSVCRNNMPKSLLVGSSRDIPQLGFTMPNWTEYPPITLTMTRFRSLEC
jgi:hypothetical protein